MLEMSRIQAYLGPRKPDPLHELWLKLISALATTFCALLRTAAGIAPGCSDRMTRKQVSARLSHAVLRDR